HRAGRPLRRHRLWDARLAPPRPARQARPHSGRRDRGHQGAEPASARRQGRRAAHAERPGVHRDLERARPPRHARGVREHHRPPDGDGRGRAVKDIGRAELGSQDYNSFGRLNGKPGGAMAVYLLPGANQLKAADTIYETMEHAKALFPPDMDYKIVYDTTPAVEASIHEILKTFVEALILVTLVVYI